MDHLTTREAADRLDLSIRQVQTLIRRGHLPAERLGRDWAIMPADVEAFQRRPVGRPRKTKHVEPQRSDPTSD